MQKFRPTNKKLPESYAPFVPIDIVYYAPARQTGRFKRMTLKIQIGSFQEQGPFCPFRVYIQRVRSAPAGPLLLQEINTLGFFVQWMVQEGRK